MSAKPADVRPKATDSSKKVHIADTQINRHNWYKHVNWLNVFFILGIPLYGCIQALFVPLQLKTAIWAVVYYFCTGLGITAGMLPYSQPLGSSGNTNSHQVTTVFGLTALIPLVSPCVSGSLLLAVVPSRVLLAGGLVTTVPITVIPTPTRTPTPSARVCSTRTWDGWS